MMPQIKPEGQEIYYTFINTSSRREKRDGKHVTMVLIDYKTAHDIVPRSWIIDCLKLYKISDEVIKSVEENMENEIDSNRKKFS